MRQGFSLALFRLRVVWVVGVVLAMLTASVWWGATPAGSSPLLSRSVVSAPLATDGGADAAAGDSINGMMRVARLSPMLVKPSSTVTIEVVVTNTGESTISDATVSFNLMRYRMSTRSVLDAWESQGIDAIVGSHMGADELPNLKPGQSRRASISVDASSFGLLGGETGWGPRGVSLVLGGTQDGEYSARLDMVHTYLVWDSRDENAEPLLDVATTVPIVGPAVATADSTQSAVQRVEAAMEGSRLARVLDVVDNHSDVTLLVDPEYVEGLADAVLTPMTSPVGTEAGGENSDDTSTDSNDSSGGDGDTANDDNAGTDQNPDSPLNNDSEGDDPDQGDGDGDTYEPTIEQQSAATWLDTFTTLDNHEIFSLFPFDGDLAAYAAAGGTPAPISLDNYSTPAIERWKTGVASFVGVAPTLADVASSVRAGQPWVLADPGTIEESATRTFTDSAAIDVTTPAGDATVLLPDEELSQQLTSPGTTNPVLARQRFAAEFAVLGKERPSERRSVVLSTPRTWDPNTDVAQAQLEAIGSLPWVTEVSLEELATNAARATDTSVAIQSPESTADPSAGLPDTTLTEELLDARAHIDDLATLTDDPAAVLSETRATLSALLSVAWRDHPMERSTLLTELREPLLAGAEAVDVSTNPDINLISTGSEIPLTVRNRFDQDVSVTVRLMPSESTLQVTDTVSVIVPAYSSTGIRVPVEAAGSGDVTVAIDILNDNGDVARSAQPFTVRVRADWENTGTLVLGALLVLLLGGGIIRTLRRGRSQKRTDAQAVHETIERVKAETEGGPAADTDGGHHHPDETAPHATPTNTKETP